MDIFISQGIKRYRMKAELILKNEVCEKYNVYPVNNPDLFIVIENNKPLIRERYKLKKRRIDWKQIEGKRLSPRTLQEIISKIERNGIEEFEKPLLNIFSKAKSRRDQFSSMDKPTLGELAKVNIPNKSN